MHRSDSRAAAFCASVRSGRSQPPSFHGPAKALGNESIRRPTDDHRVDTIRSDLLWWWLPGVHRLLSAQWVATVTPTISSGPEKGRMKMRGVPDRNVVVNPVPFDRLDLS